MRYGAVELSPKRRGRVPLSGDIQECASSRVAPAAVAGTEPCAAPCTARAVPCIRPARTAFTNNSHIVAIRTTGNVYSYDAVEQLNIKAKNWRDLLSDEPFTRSDIIVLQDPARPDARNLSLFHHITHHLQVDDAERERARSDPLYHIRPNMTTEAILEELQRESSASAASGTASDTGSAGAAAPPSSIDSLYSSGAAATGLTSTAMQPITQTGPTKLSQVEAAYETARKAVRVGGRAPGRARIGAAA